MTRKSLFVSLAAAAAVAVIAYAAYWWGMDRGMTMAGATATAAPAQPGRKVLYWHDPMVPNAKFDKPGKSPFMDMALVPVYADEAASGAPAVRIDPGLEQNLGMRTAEVTRGRLGTAVEAIGNVAYNERDSAVVQARSNGYIERLDVRAPLDPVRKGQPLAQMYVPDWVAAQEDYLSVRRMGAQAPAGLLEASEQRMRIAGMTPAQIALVESDGREHARLTVVSPIDGVVAELNVREGATVMNGAPLFRINGLRTVWVNAEVPESSAESVRPGASAEVSTPAFPGEKFAAKVGAILPQVDPSTRTLKARLEVANPRGRLVPGMFARIRFAPAPGDEMLVVPSDAVIRTGTRNLVMVAGEQGKFVPVEVEVGEESGGRTEIRKGLQAGQKVVVSGQFLLDSEASLKGIEARMRAPDDSRGPASQGLTAQGGGSQAPPVVTHHGSGRVERITADQVTISHGPIPSLHWPAMTMGFKPPPGGPPAGLKQGDAVTFEIRELPDGAYGLTQIAPSSGAAR